MSTSIFTEYQVNLEVEYFTEPCSSYRTLRFSEGVALLLKHHSRVNRLASDLFDQAEALAKRQKGIRGLPRLPAWITTESIGARNLTKPAEECKSLEAPAVAVAIAFPSEGRI